MNSLLSDSKKSSLQSLCFWSWNYDLDEEEITRQLLDFKNGRFGGVIVHSRAGLRIPYLGKEWFKAYDYTIKQAEKLGLEVWIYDEDGWPSGFAGGAVPALGNQHWIKNLKFSKEKSHKPEQFIAAWHIENNSYKTIPYNEVKDGDLVCSYETDNHYVDLLSYDTVSAFIQITHERYKAHFKQYFGNVIKGVFTDEPQVKKLPWSLVLRNAWFERYGEDICEKLFMLVDEEGKWRKFRSDYRKLVSDLLNQSFTKQISNWCNKNNLIMTGHFAAEDGLCAQAAQNCGVMRQYVDMQMPGIDHLGNRITSPVLSKQVSSIASQFNKTDVLSETFGCAGWNVSFERLRWIWGWQSLLGITKPCFHLSAYSIVGRRKRDYPAFFSYQEPWWDEFPKFAHWINEINCFMKRGSRIVDVLIIAPLDTVLALYSANEDNGKAELYSSEYRQLLQNLLSLQIDYEIGDETVMNQYARVDGNKFIIGKSSYHTVVIPYTLSLNKNTFNLINQFVNNGGKVIYIGCHPELCEYKKAIYPACPVVQNRRNLLDNYIIRSSLKRPVTVIYKNNFKVVNNAFVHIRNAGDSWHIHIWTGEQFNSENTAILIDDFPAENAKAYSIDFINDTKSPLIVRKVSDKLLIEAQLKAESNFIVELSPSDQFESVSRDVLIGTEVIRNPEINICDDNCLTIDKASISINGSEYSECLPLIKMLNYIYDERNKILFENDMVLNVRYTFNCKEEFKPESLFLAVENSTVNGICVNGNVIDKESGGWWIDREIGLYNIQPFVRDRKNEIILTYSIPPNAQSVSITEGFETERNRFYYPVEPESIYLKGKFDVKCTVAPQDNSYYHTVDDGFSILPPSLKTMGNLTIQNMWFYRGRVSYTFSVKKGDDKKIFLRIINPFAALAIWKIGEHSGIFSEINQAVDISEFLSSENNYVTVEIEGSNRNLLGPHHHIRGEVAMVGPDTFQGVKGFEDFVSPDIVDNDTWTDKYNFVPFGIDAFEVFYYKKQM